MKGWGRDRFRAAGAPPWFPGRSALPPGEMNLPRGPGRANGPGGRKGLPLGPYLHIVLAPVSRIRSHRSPMEGRTLLTHPSCLFCRIAAGEIPAEMVLTTPDLVAFRDINPQAPTHILLIPRKHVASVSALEPSGAEMMGKLFLAARDLARAEGIEDGGYRMVVNAGPDAGQTVFHIHLHLMGGREMGWPPG